jgi:hypothetical protein
MTQQQQEERRLEQRRKLPKDMAEQERRKVWRRKQDEAQKGKQ